MNNLVLSPFEAKHIQEMVVAFDALGWDKPYALYEGYLKEHKNKTRFVLIATVDTLFAGYVTLKWESEYEHFKKQGIPEIVDLNVLPQFRRQGIGTALINACEKLAKENGYSHIGLGVGMTADYGSAQRLYIRLGYLPDGEGLYHKKHRVMHGDMVCVDDDLGLHLVKRF